MKIECEDKSGYKQRFFEFLRHFFQKRLRNESKIQKNIFRFIEYSFLILISLIYPRVKRKSKKEVSNTLLEIDKKDMCSIEQEALYRRDEKIYDLSIQIENGNCFDSLFIWRYQEPIIKTLITTLKFNNDSKSIALCAAVLSDEIIAFSREQLLSPLLPLLVTIPSTAKHINEKDFDQMQSIIKIIKHQTKNFIDDTVNVSNAISINKSFGVENTKQSKSSNRFERIIGAHNKYISDSTIVRGKTVILLDDIITTGATLADAVRSLRTAGATYIYSMALAH